MEKHKEMQKALLSVGLNIQSELTFEQDGTQQKIILPVQKQIENLGAIVGKASSMVKEDVIVDKFPDDNWIASFCDSAKDISREEMQKLWAQVLAREIQNPESVSIRTLGILKTLDPKTARLFEKLCSMCFVVNQKNNTFNAVVPCFYGHAGNNALEGYGLSFDDLNCLNEYNLIMLEYHSAHRWVSWADYVIPIMDGEKIFLPESMCFQFQGKKWILIATEEYKRKQQRKEKYKRKHADKSLFKIPGIMLNLAGQELLPAVDVKPNDKFADYVRHHLLLDGVKIVEIEDADR